MACFVKKNNGIYIRVMTLSSLLVAVNGCGKLANDSSSANDSKKIHIEQGNIPLVLDSQDKPFFDSTVYGSRAGDFVMDATEGEAVTFSSIKIENKKINYTATTGHLVTVDSLSSLPNAKMFYVAFTANNNSAEMRPVTFLYNGGPGSAAVWLLLGSFSPKRIKTSLPDYTPPAPYTLEDNPDSLLDKTDLVFINPVGTGYSAAISPFKNQDFWGVDQDARSISSFIKRYLSKNGRWNSPKYLMGESYGTPRSAVTSFQLHNDGIDLNGITLISSILDYSKWWAPEGMLPTFAANARYHKKTRGVPTQTLPEYMEEIKSYSKNVYAPVMQNWIDNYNKFNNLLTNITDPQLLKYVNDAIKYSSNYNDVILSLSLGSTNAKGLAKQLSDQLNNIKVMDDSIANQTGNYTGLNASVIKSLTILPYNQTPFSDITNYAVMNLLADKGKAIGIYDGRATGINTGIAKDIRNYLARDPSTVNIQSAYTAAWNFYLNGELKYFSTSAFQDLNEIISTVWDYSHIDPTGTDRGGSGLYTAGDLAATMSMNPDLKVFQASGYYDSVTPFNQTNLDLAAMDIDPSLRKNIEINIYPSGHMIYLEGNSRKNMKQDLAKFYDATTHDPYSMQRILRIQNNTLSKMKLIND